MHCFGMRNTFSNRIRVSISNWEGTYAQEVPIWIYSFVILSRRRLKTFSNQTGIIPQKSRKIPHWIYDFLAGIIQVFNPIERADDHRQSRVLRPSLIMHPFVIPLCHIWFKTSVHITGERAWNASWFIWTMHVLTIRRNLLNFWKISCQ
jgi:hypothetical protein